MTTRFTATSFLAVSIAFTAGTAMGQSCTPGWEGAIGVPGITRGYVSVFFPFDDGAGERLFVGGSFDAVSGVPSSRLLAKWNPANNTWSSAGSGLSTGFTNGFLTSLAVFDAGEGDELIAGGFYASAGTAVDSASLARWNGQRWENCGTGWNANNRGSVWAMKRWDGFEGDRLYVGGSFALIGGVTANGIAAWDGQAWAALGTGITGSFNPNVSAFEVFDDGTGPALYAGGRFDTMNGVFTPWLAKWDGQTWSRVGGGITPINTLTGIEAMAIHDDGNGPALYVGGGSFAPAGATPTNVARWDGQTWTSLGSTFTGRVTRLASFDDGAGERLYLGGTALPAVEQFARWEHYTWMAVDGTGVGGTPVPPSNFPSVFGLDVVGDRMYVGGNFTTAGSFTIAGIAWRQACPPECYPDCDTSTGRGVLDIFDFLCFGNRYAANDPYACNCDFTGPGVCDIFDFLCFGNAFSAGCP